MFWNPAPAETDPAELGTVIVTSDLGKTTGPFGLTRKGRGVSETTEYDVDAVREPRCGIEPGRLPVEALVPGDTSDNIQGERA